MYTPSWSSKDLCVPLKLFIITLVLLEIPALDSAAYNFSWEKTGWGNYTPKLFILWPFALVIVIAKYNLIGNCLLYSLNGKSECDGDNSILNAQSPMCDPLVMWNLNILVVIEIIFIVVPLHNPEFTSIFLKNITNARCFNSNLGIVIEIICSILILYCMSTIQVYYWCFFWKFCYCYRIYITIAIFRC